MFDLLGLCFDDCYILCLQIGSDCVSNLDWWVSNLEIGVDFVNKEDASLVILIGVCWVQISVFNF